jgi:hypothetical protein
VLFDGHTGVGCPVCGNPCGDAAHIGQLVGIAKQPETPMTNDEQKQLEQLREQLESANRTASQTRDLFSSALSKSTDELRLYRGLFWCLLFLGVLGAIFTLLQK